VTLPTHKTAREVRLAQDLASATVLLNDEIEALIEVLQRDDILMAELMAVCARPGQRPDDSGLEFVTSGNDFPSMWMLSGGDLESTHYLPEPNDPQS
jgi:hypothetical protein